MPTLSRRILRAHIAATTPVARYDRFPALYAVVALAGITLAAIQLF